EVLRIIPTAMQRGCKDRAVKFRTIVIDPPWPYDDRVNAKNRGAANHYPLMSLHDLSLLPVREVAEDDAHLYLWTTNAFVASAFMLVKMWGFEQKTMLTWVKPQIGMGHYFRNNTEHVVFAVRGKLAGKSRSLPTAFRANRRQHSEKPLE